MIPFGAKDWLSGSDAFERRKTKAACREGLKDASSYYLISTSGPS